MGFFSKLFKGPELIWKRAMQMQRKCVRCFTKQ